MTQTQLDGAVALLTGEPLRTIHRGGFHLMSQATDRHESEDLRLVLDCPFCGRPVAYPGRAGDGSDALAECGPCDVYFEFRPDEVYAVTETREPTGRAGRYRPEP